MALSQVIRTKITPPRQTPRILKRDRIIKILCESLNYRLSLVQAGAGYGKSTALAALSVVSETGPREPAEELQYHLVWYQVAKEDSDPLVFLLHLCHATQLAIPNIQGLPTSNLEVWDGERGPLPSSEIVHSYINALSEVFENNAVKPVMLVLDDIHLAIEAPEIAMILDRLIGLAPSDLHILLSGRPPIKLPNLSRWQSSGDVLHIDQSLLAFTPAEITLLFTDYYAYELTQEEVEKLHNATEGWAVALQVIWQSLRSGAAASIDEALARQTSSLGSLFEVLAQEVLGKQPQDVQEFLKAAAILRTMTPNACDALRDSSDSTAMLAYLRRQELFVVDLGEAGLRFQYIFHRFLRQRSEDAQRRQWHRQAAQYYRKQGDPDSVLYHLLKAQDYSNAASFLATYGRNLLESGRLDTLNTHLESLPPETFHQHPDLLAYLGDLARLHSRFQDALVWYQQAEAIWRERGQPGEAARALRGQARVYLDTVDPSRAEELLQQALRLSDGIADRETQARLYKLLAENKLNAGKPEEAERLRQQAEALRHEGPDDSQLYYRVLLRTGRIEEARRALETQVEAERIEPIQVPRSHRESLFLLSLTYAFEGKAQEAYQTALQGTQRGLDLDSPFMIAVGHMRQGHALMLLGGDECYDQARSQFQRSVEISHSLDIPRLRVEACWGISRAYGYQGDLSAALAATEEGIRIANQAGDEWVASLVILAYGASLTLAARYESNLEWLMRAARGFQACSDSFGYTAARLWSCLGWQRQDDFDRLAQALPEVLENCQERGYDFLFTRPTLLGVPDERLLAPLLIIARDQGWHSAYAGRLLSAIGLTDIRFHPGYQLRVHTLGKFQVQRGDQLIPNHGWRREKTRLLFQLLLTNRHYRLERDQIFEHLWPGAEPAMAARNFKVVLNTLFNVLESERKPGSESAYILRTGSIYGLRPEADLWLDAQEFTQLLHQAESLPNDRAKALLERAAGLYQGEYLPDARYESWAAAEREHLAVQFLRSADRLCEIYIDKKNPSEAIDLCQRILAQDNCWERAYRHLMLAYHQLGDRGQVARTFQRCTQVLEGELNVSPSSESEMLYQKLID